MKQAKQKTHKNLLIQQFRQKCKQQLKQQPKNYLTVALKDNLFTLDLTQFVPDDLIFFQVILTLPINRLHIFIPEPEAGSPSKSKNAVPPQAKPFYQTLKFKDFVRMVSTALQQNSSIKTLKLERIPLTAKLMKQFSEGIKGTKSLRELSFSSCKLTEQHLQSIKTSLAENQSLITLDLSGNELCQVGSMIGHILSQHSRRRSEMIWMFNLRGEMPVEDISNMGLCEVNLQRNRLNDKSAVELSSFLKNDSWTKCINLKKNSIHLQGVKEFAIMLKSNSSLISLDLRQNEGLTREYSRYIYKKLLLNMERYKQQKQEIEKNRVIMASHQRSQLQAESIIRQYNSQDHPPNQFKSLRGQSHFQQKYDNNQYSTIVENKKAQRNNLTVDQKNHPRIPESNQKQQKLCNNCKQKTFEVLRLEKKNLDLELQLRQVRNALLTKNIDISAIMPIKPPQQPHGHGSLTELLANRSNQNDEELLQRMQQIMLELTRVMEGIEQQQQTKENMTNPLDNPNSFSNTINLYPHNSHLQELSKQIQEDRLQSIFEATSSLEHRIDDITS